MITKRHIASWVLLAVYLPMLIFSSLHIHEVTDASETACAECLHHQCQGHLTQLSGDIHQCVLCQFLTLSYIATATKALVCFQPHHKPNYVWHQQAKCLTCFGFISLRAPPAVWKTGNTFPSFRIKYGILHKYIYPDYHTIYVCRGGHI